MRLQGACIRALVIVSLFQCSVCFQVCLQYICVEASKIALMVFLQYVFPNCLFRRQHKGTRCTSKLFLQYVFSCASLNCGFCSNRILHYFPMCVCQSITDVTSQVFTMIWLFRPCKPYGSVSAGREKWPFNDIFFKVEPPCDQTWWDSLVFSILSCFSYVSHAKNTLVGLVGSF